MKETSRGAAFAALKAKVVAKKAAFKARKAFKVASSPLPVKKPATRFAYK